VVVVLTALDRPFLGVHYPSDVTVGALTGVGLVLASYAGYAGWNPPEPPSTAHDPDTTPASTRDAVTKEA
jgi:undecaprenyl-diphosphatase